MSQRSVKQIAKQVLMEKILLHLADCIDFGVDYKLKKGLGISGKLIRSFIKSDEKNFEESVAGLRRSKFIEKKENYDGSILITLTERGRMRALNLKFRRLGNKKEKWDGLWRMVAFDIPNERKKGREALRYRLKNGGFFELQESLFLYPYNCQKEIEEFVDLFKLKGNVRFALLNYIDNEEEIMRRFSLERKTP